MHTVKGEKTALQPSTRYLSSSRIPSTTIADPASNRKLLILDLNGTLIHRPKLRPGQRHGTAALRPAHPRPYTPSFGHYLAHPNTRAWLDTIVWSSAQPHSVADMVKKAFSGVDEHFLAVWARDTFGLKPEQYQQKVLTIKDLDVVWKAFPQHSSSTTVLLDDSPRKAQLQPWNHIVLKEYVTKLRSDDLAVWQSLRTAAPGKKQQKKEAKRLAKEQGKASTVKDKLVESFSVLRHSSASTKEPELVTADVSTTEAPITQPAAALVYDETLLAIIGILEAMKSQSNVSHWLREGGLGLANPEYASPTGTDPAFWFHDADVVQGWVEQGKEVLKELDIELEPGIRG